MILYCVCLLVEFRDTVFVGMISFRGCFHDYVLSLVSFRNMNVDTYVCAQDCDHDFESLFEHVIHIEITRLLCTTRCSYNRDVHMVEML